MVHIYLLEWLVVGTSTTVGQFRLTLLQGAIFGGPEANTVKRLVKMDHSLSFHSCLVSLELFDEVLLLAKLVLDPAEAGVRTEGGVGTVDHV